MGIWDVFTDIVEAATPWSVVEAEAPAAEEEPQEESTESEEKTDEPEEDGDAEAEGGDEEDEDEDEDDEDEEEELVDPKDTFEEECRNSAQCAPAKHHFEHCVERVQEQQENGGAKEDCVEEFFHLAHCATECAAPKLWAKLK